MAEDVLQGSDTMFCCQYAVLANSIVLTDDADTNHIKYSSRSVTSCHGRDEFAVLCRIQSTITEIFRDAGFLTEKMQQAIDARVLQSGHWVLSSIARRAEPVGEALREAYGVVRSEAYTQAYGRYKQTRGAVGFPVVDPETVPAPEPLSGARIVVSMTSHPGRIRTVAPVLETIYAQTRMPDEVVLWLAEEQFPEKALPEELTALVEAGRLTVRWCGDLMPHKKYFYAFREYPDDLVITVDDDLLYAPTTIEQLYQSFLVHPRAVSALRAHLMLIENGRLLPYDDWLREFNLFAGEASMLLFATNGAGALFPPHLLRAELLDEEAIRQTCPYADDIWLKLMEIEADVPVVLAKPYAGLKYMPGTQEQTLYARYNRELNDAQLAAAIAWFDARYGEGCIMNRLAGYHDRLQGLRIIAAYHREKMEKKSAAIEKRDRKIEKLRSELTRLWGSRPMRIGRAATWPARALRGSFKKSP